MELFSKNISFTQNKKKNKKSKKIKKEKKKEEWHMPKHLRLNIGDNQNKHSKLNKTNPNVPSITTKCKLFPSFRILTKVVISRNQSMSLPSSNQVKLFPYFIMFNFSKLFQKPTIISK